MVLIDLDQVLTYSHFVPLSPPPPPNICRKDGQEIMLAKSSRKPGGIIKSPEVTCLHSINRSVAWTVPGAQPDYSHATTIKTFNVHQDCCPNSARSEQHVDEDWCQETCSPMHPTEILLLLFLPRPEHTHLSQPSCGRGKQAFTGEGRASQSHGKGWKVLLRAWLLA